MSTARGKASRKRLLETAADLFLRQGVAATSVDRVLAEAGAGKSQFYHYFKNKQNLIQEVIGFRIQQFITEKQDLLENLDSWENLTLWLNSVVSWFCVGDHFNGCPIGVMAAEMAEQNEVLRQELVTAFELWEHHIAAGLAKMKARGEIRNNADPTAMDQFVIAANQGALLLARTKQSESLLRNLHVQIMCWLKTHAQVPDD